MKKSLRPLKKKTSGKWKSRPRKKAELGIRWCALEKRKCRKRDAVEKKKKTASEKVEKPKKGGDAGQTSCSIKEKGLEIGRGPTRQGETNPPARGRTRTKKVLLIQRRYRKPVGGRQDVDKRDESGKSARKRFRAG